jgi:hypothetical protein
VNAAFLLVTSALMVGQAGKPAPTPPPAAPAPVVASSCGSNCGSTCGQDACGCEGGHRLRDRLRGWFKRDRCDSCNTCDTCKPTCHEHKPVCHEPKPVCHVAKPACDECRSAWLHREHACRTHCAPAPKCDTCDSCGRANLLGRLRERFRHCDSGCDTGCGTACASGCGGAVTGAPPKTEKIEAPKKMPEAPPKKTAEVRIETPAPFAPNAIRVSPAAPSVEVAPVPAPRVEGDRRDPF